MDLAGRARVHAALGDPHRLAIVDELTASDRSFQELARLVGLPGNAAAHHLAVLESAGLIERAVSEGDRRRRYVSLRWDALDGLISPCAGGQGAILFVCTHNSARSQFATALWRARTGRVADSAGTDPAGRVHPLAVRAAAEHGIDITDAVPKGYDGISIEPELIVSVCDRAREAGLPFGSAPSLHWSIPDPVRAGDLPAFRRAFEQLAERIDRITPEPS